MASLRRCHALRANLNCRRQALTLSQLITKISTFSYLIRRVVLLTQPTYASRAAENFNSQDLISIASTAQRKNAIYGLTGALCYANGTFLQYFEGEHLPVHRLYQNLLEEKRHSQLKIVSVHEIAARRFPTWAMGFFSYKSDIGQLFIAPSKMAELSPFSMTTSNANEFFNEVVKYVSIA